MHESRMFSPNKKKPDSNSTPNVFFPSSHLHAVFFLFFRFYFSKWSQAMGRGCEAEVGEWVESTEVGEDIQRVVAVVVDQIKIGNVTFCLTVGQQSCDVNLVCDQNTLCNGIDFSRAYIYKFKNLIYNQIFLLSKKGFPISTWGKRKKKF